MTTYAQFQQKSSSEKMGLAIVEAARRLSGWTLYSGTIWSIPFTDSSVVTEVSQDGAALTSVASVGAVTPGTYFFDRTNDTLFLETTTSAAPSGFFIGVEFRLYFAEGPAIAPYDLSTGFDVEWLPILRPLSAFGVKLDNRDQLGLAIEGSGSIQFFNDLNYWRPRYDKYYFENKRVFIYSWSHTLPITEAKLIYRGRIQSKSYSDTTVSFRLRDFINELRSPPSLSNLSDLGALIPDGLKDAKQRRIYGYVFGFRPQNIDQVLDGYSLSGTVSVTFGSPTVTGVGTTFFADFSPGDQIIIAGAEEPVTVDSIAADTTLTLTEDFSESDISGATYKIKPELSKRYANRTHFVSGDTLAEPATTITSVTNGLIFDVADVSSLRAGDPVIINGEERTILRISDNTVRLTIALSSVPSVSDTVTRPSFSNVKINDTVLTRTRDFTVPASNDRIVLDQLAEFNNAKLETFGPGTMSFTTGSKQVVGTGTTYTATVKPGDWVRSVGESAYFEVGDVRSDTDLRLRTNSTYTASGSANIKRPNYYTEGEDVLTCDAIGITDDGTKTGNLLFTGPDIVKDMLLKAGVDAADINTATFNNSADIASYRIGFAIPPNYNDKTVPKTRDLVNDVNQSIIGALVQNEDFKFDYNVIGPGRTISDTKVDETQALSFSVTSDSNNIVKDTIVQYNNKEYDPLTMDASFSTVTATSKNAQYLAKTSNTETKSTLLVDQSDAIIISERYAFIRDVASSVVKIKTKLQTSRLQVTDIIKFSHPKLYERFGSTTSEKIAGISSLVKSSSEVDLELDDLGNTFTRCSVITADTASDFATATDDEKVANGYITDDDGTINQPLDTGINVIF